MAGYEILRPARSWRSSFPRGALGAQLSPGPTPISVALALSVAPGRSETRAHAADNLPMLGDLHATYNYCVEPGARPRLRFSDSTAELRGMTRAGAEPAAALSRVRGRILIGRHGGN